MLRYTSTRTTPVDVSGLTSSVVAVSIGGWHSCAVASNGGVKCWGDNEDGQLGDGTTTDRYTRVDAIGLTSGAAAVAVGTTHTCALMIAGAVRREWFGFDQ
jgi:alpha-tubulin suppressor-like RCC1 family protein